MAAASPAKSSITAVPRRRLLEAPVHQRAFAASTNRSASSAATSHALSVHTSHARNAVQRLKIHAINILKGSYSSSFPDTPPSSNSPLFDQQSTDISHSG